MAEQTGQNSADSPALSRESIILRQAFILHNQSIRRFDLLIPQGRLHDDEELRIVMETWQLL